MLVLRSEDVLVGLNDGSVRLVDLKKGYQKRK